MPAGLRRCRKLIVRSGFDYLPLKLGLRLRYFDYTPVTVIA
jgi:hypothetical protein